MISARQHRRMVEVACILDVSRTAESLHAHAVPEGIRLRPGDVVLVHGAPGRIADGERLRRPGRATVIRAGWLTRCWIRIAGLFALAELIDVGVAPRETR